MARLVTTTHNYDGAGVEQSTTDQTTINANGSKTEVVTDYTGTTTNGTVRDVTTTYSGIILAGLGDETAITTQSNGSVANYRVEIFPPTRAGRNGMLSNTIPPRVGHFCAKPPMVPAPTDW